MLQVSVDCPRSGRVMHAHVGSSHARSGSATIKFGSEQTPLVYDPMSTMLFGYASCTGISLLLIDALRTAGE